jgi:LCP family protein required for cell wall assembly
LVGSDSRTFVQSAADRATFGVPADSEGQHADVILLLRIENGGHEEVLPVPRDLFTLLPDGAPTRITMSLQSGPQTVVDTLCDSLGVGVNHLVLIHMNGLRSLVDDVGGITVHAATPERDTVTGLSIAHAGSAHLDGVQALAYARSRHLEYLEHGVWLPASTASDERSGRDAQVLSLLGARLHISPTAPLASARTLWELSGAVTVDGGTSPRALAQLAGALGHMQTAAHLVLPVTFNPGYVPVDDLAPGGPEVLARFNGGRTPHCSIRTGLNPTAPSGGTT